MIIRSIRIRHFRSVLDEEVEFGVLTSLVGANGAGKSAILHALRIFYEPATPISVEDFYDRDTSEPIVVGVTFADLSPEARQQFDPYVQADLLSVERVVIWDGKKASGSYHGARLQARQFEEVRDAFW